jgi:phosphate transport system permease protein
MVDRAENIPWPQRARRRWSATHLSCWGFSLVAVAFVVGLIALFVWQSVPVWKQEGAAYFTGKNWYYRTHQFGIAPMLYGTLITSVIALLLAAPLGIAAAVCIAEYLPGRVRFAVKILVELLAGIPSVVYGLLGILLLRDWVYDALERFEPLSGDTLLTAGILLAVMILPTIVTLTDDALRAVPAAQRLAARGLGLNRAEMVFRIALPQARAGVVAAVLLALGRALGEMIAVFLVVGRQDNLWKPFSLEPIISPGQTLASKLGGAETNIAFGDPLHFAAMVGLGLVLLALAGTATLAGAWLMGRKDRHA